MSKFDRIAVLTVVIFGFVLLSMFFANKLIPVSIACENPNGCASISVNGSVTFRFSRAVDPDLAEALFSIDVGTKSELRWEDGKTLRWITSESLTSPGRIVMRFSPGVMGKQGETLRRMHSWEITVQEPEIVGIGPTGEGSDALFLISRDLADDAIQLTPSGVNVLQYAPSPDGASIVFTANNTQGGVDLYQVDRNGENSIVLAECGKDKCNYPSWSPESDKIVFTRESLNQEEESIKPFILDLGLGEKNIIQIEVVNSISQPRFSPDGNWLSMIDISGGGLILVNLNTNEMIKLDDAAENNGCWAPDLSTYYFISMENADGVFWNRINAVDLTERIQRVIRGDVLGLLDWSTDRIVCNPINNSLAVRIQPNIRIPGYELAVIDLLKNSVNTVFRDYSQVIHSYAWSPDGKRLLFSTQYFGDDPNNVIIQIWDSESMVLEFIANGYRDAKWIP